MALISCPECKNQVSSEAKSCPKCGKALKKSLFWIYIVIAIVIVFIISITLISRKRSVEIAENKKIEQKERLSDTIDQLGDAVKDFARKRKMELDSAAANKQVLRGMSQDQVIDAWGLPDNKSSKMTEDGTGRVETWFYIQRESAVAFLIQENVAPIVFNIQKY